jgi:hypothetical protein
MHDGFRPGFLKDLAQTVAIQNIAGIQPRRALSLKIAYIAALDFRIIETVKIVQQNNVVLPAQQCGRKMMCNESCAPCYQNTHHGLQSVPVVEIG